MATREDKRRRRMRRKAHADRIDRTIEVGGQPVDVKKPRRATPSYHKPLPGQNLTQRQRQQLQAVGRDVHGELIPIDIGFNGSKIEISTGTVRQMSGPHAPTFHADEVELMNKDVWDASSQLVDGFVSVDALATEAMLHPSESEWDLLVGAAKQRKRGIAKFATKAGYELIDNVSDPKDRLSWRRVS